MWCIIGYHIIQYQTHPNADQMKPLLEKQFIRSISQFKCQFSIEQAFSLSVSWAFHYNQNTPGAEVGPGCVLLMGPCRAIQLAGAGSFSPHPPWPSVTLPKTERGQPKKSSLLTWLMESLPFFCFPWRDDSGHHTCLSALLFIGWTVTRWLHEPVQVTPASQGFSGACFCTLMLVHP